LAASAAAWIANSWNRHLGALKGILESDEDFVKKNHKTARISDYNIRGVIRHRRSETELHDDLEEVRTNNEESRRRSQ
ncbi:hypothetical protein LINGRAPRIM_LOCUS2408, partial [Linum grandiflorum]